MTPVEFLTARLDEREAKAKAATPGPWQDSGTILAGVLGAGHQTVAACNSSEWDNQEYSYPASAEESANSAFIAANDPAYVLADIAAKRRLIELAQDATGLDMSVDNDRGVGVRDWLYIGDVMVRVMCQPFSDHPDYNPAWQL